MVKFKKASLLTLSLLSLTATTTLPKLADYIPFKWLGFMKTQKNPMGKDFLEAVRDKASQETIMKYIEDGIDVNFQDKNGATALMISTLYGDLELTQMLLEKGANPNLQGKVVGLTPIILAVHNSNDVQMATLLLENGADPNLKTYIGFTTLMYSILNKNIEMTKLLLSYKANVNDQEFIAGLTPIIIAVANNDLVLTKLLLEHDADITIKDKSEKNAIDYAKETKSKEIIDLIVPEEELTQENNQETLKTQKTE